MTFISALFLRPLFISYGNHWHVLDWRFLAWCSFCLYHEQLCPRPKILRWLLNEGTIWCMCLSHLTDHDEIWCTNTMYIMTIPIRPNFDFFRIAKDHLMALPCGRQISKYFFFCKNGTLDGALISSIALFSLICSGKFNFV